MLYAAEVEVFQDYVVVAAAFDVAADVDGGLCAVCQGKLCALDEAGIEDEAIGCGGQTAHSHIAHGNTGITVRHLAIDGHIHSQVQLAALFILGRG